MTLAEKWVEEGMQRGIEKGAREREIEMAKEAIREGVDFGLISKLTGLPESKIAEMTKEVGH